MSMSWWAGVSVLAVVFTGGCSRSEVKNGRADIAPSTTPSFTLFALAEVRGQIGPCGCTSDPLGDIARTAQLVVAARAAGPVLVVDAGSLLYSQSPVPAQLAAQEELKADLLRDVYKDDLQVAAVGLGPADLANGADAIRLPREVANLAPGATIPIDPPKLVQVGDAKVGVFGVIAHGAIVGLAIAARARRSSSRSSRRPRRRTRSTSREISAASTSRSPASASTRRSPSARRSRRTRPAMRGSSSRRTGGRSSAASTSRCGQARPAH
jgi:hypothetical protein